MLNVVAKKIFGTRNDRVLKGMRPLVNRVNELEKKYKAMTDEELRGQTTQFKERLAKGESLDSIQPEAFAVVREGAFRALGMRHFDVQLIGGAVLHSGMIAEMKTGEGKTLVATLPAYLNALSGKGVHIVTVNDYLARRDSEWMGRVYNFLGLSTGVVYAGLNEDVKRAAYLADITYGQNNEYGFDYLRDNMKFSMNEVFQREHHFAIVDEVDSILVDEARTPLIISGPAEDPTDKYHKINKIIPHLERDKHFQIELRTKQPSLTEEGVARVEALLEVENLYEPNNIELLHHTQQALKAHAIMERDVDYVVREGQVIIVDEFTGRLMPGRRWSDGLHQAIEAKEGVTIARENQTLASITFQNYFRMYKKLSGMTGTADTEAVEFKQIYNLDVVVIPTNKPMVRLDESDQVYRTRKEKYEAVIEEISATRESGQPILVGTISIEQSEALSKMLRTRGVEHKVLNAKQHEREAEIVAQAGRFGSVTISTNMAGRGTDIVLGGNPDFLAQAEAETKDRNDPAYIEAFKKFSAMCAEEKAKVLQAGGLFIIGTERHESRRIDNQLRGRAGRQGDPGKTRFYVSLEDDLMMRFGGERIQTLMKRLGWEEGIAIDGRLISRSIESAQKKVEAFHFDSRKHVTEYDDVMNKQRQVVYNLRNRVLSNEGVREEVLTMADDLLEEAVLGICNSEVKPRDWNLKQLSERYEFLFKSTCSLPNSSEQQVIFDSLRKQARDLYADRVPKLSAKLSELESLSSNEAMPIRVQISRSEDKPFDLTTIEQDTILETLDHLWNIHLQMMDHLREGIGLRGYGQKNPLHEYQKEGFLLFQRMLDGTKEAIVRKLYYYEVPEARELLAHIQAEQKRREALEQQMRLIHDSPVEGTQVESVAGPLPAGGAPQAARDPEEQRAKLEAQKKARRKAAGK
ncbi:MAG: preprotein translocase subunit SecA [Deltaproteobacteria bacterium]|nr:preprotein translocase subunit SecA [Deltaproteobacteria bacterium]